MNVVTQQILKDELNEDDIPWVSYDKATHMVVGFSDDGSGGILATAEDQFTAYRYRKAFAKKYPDARVVENKPEEFKKVHDYICEGTF